MNKILNWIENERWLNLASLLVLAVFAVDYLLQKHSGESKLSNLLVNVPAELTTLFLVIAFFVNLAPKLQKHFPTLKYKSPEPDGVRVLIHGANALASDLRRKLRDNLIKVESICDHHNLKRELIIVTNALAEHVIASNDAIRRSRDILITVYSLNADKQRLEYLHHYPPQRDGVNSLTISLINKEHEDYECVKCLRENRAGTIVFDKQGYKKSSSTRYGTLKHYIGFKIEDGGKVLGFVNIEFHAKGKLEYYADEEEMMLFFEQEVNVFKAFYEHHFSFDDLLKTLVDAHKSEVSDERFN
jgi:hypothetical protein